MGSAGSVAYLFERKGLFSVDAATMDEDTLMGIALDAGADDLKHQGDIFEITSDPAAFTKVKEALEAAGVKVANAEMSQVGKAPRCG